jgi:hypothetical protein
MDVYIFSQISAMGHIKILSLAPFGGEGEYFDVSCGQESKKAITIV